MEIMKKKSFFYFISALLMGVDRRKRLQSQQKMSSQTQWLRQTP